MNEKELKELVDTVSRHDKQLARFEALLVDKKPMAVNASSKQRTLRELIKGYKFKNGQEKLASIVGYHEMVLLSPIPKADFEKAWVDAKMDKKYDKSFFERGRDTLFRVDPSGTCVLTQTGEAFFEPFLNDESAGTTS